MKHKMNLHDKAVTLEILAKGHMEIQGQFVHGSNATLLVLLKHSAGERLAAYKPIRGENPLWDFPDGSLAAREVAAFLTSETLGWGFVPPTILRDDTSYGSGSVQQFFRADPRLNYFNFDLAIKSQLDRVALFDIFINNADRKASHIILDDQRRLWLIDHGVTFHHEDKLRTVIWDFAGKSIRDVLLFDLDQFLETAEVNPAIKKAYLALISEREWLALLDRGKVLLQTRRFPLPGPGRAFPYPLI
ncbi:MAG: hypothetical protein JXA97_06720 [Anaerolineales bacterium]|nr:hypothetical protein [Anaerolineales bacterium]